MKFFSCFQKYERIILLRRKWLPERLRLFTAIHNNRPIAYEGPHVKFRGGPHLPLPRHWYWATQRPPGTTSSFQCTNIPLLLPFEFLLWRNQAASRRILHHNNKQVNSSVKPKLFDSVLSAFGLKDCIGRIYFYPTTHDFSRWFSYARKS